MFKGATEVEEIFGLKENNWWCWEKKRGGGLPSAM